MEITAKIHTLLKLVISNQANYREINELVKLTHQIAMVRLRKLITSKHFHLYTYPMNLESIAFDCLAELFARDNNNVFMEIDYYFSGEREIEKLHPDDVLFHYRQLIFRTLSDGIFRLYRENDPILSKIIRNLKLTAVKIERTSLFDRWGDVYVAFGKQFEEYEHLQEFPLEELEQQCGLILGARQNSLPMLTAIQYIFENQSLYRRSFPLVSIALIIKRSLSHSRRPLQEYTEVYDPSLSLDIHSILKGVLDSSEIELRKRYFINGKLNKEEFEMYISALHKLLSDTFIQSDGSAREYYEYIREYNPAMTYEQYREQHRTRFEYAAKIAKKKVRDALQDLL